MLQTTEGSKDCPGSRELIMSKARKSTCIPNLYMSVNTRQYHKIQQNIPPRKVVLKLFSTMTHLKKWPTLVYQTLKETRKFLFTNDNDNNQIRSLKTFISLYLHRFANCWSWALCTYTIWCLNSLRVWDSYPIFPSPFGYPPQIRPWFSKPTVWEPLSWYILDCCPRCIMKCSTS